MNRDDINVALVFAKTCEPRQSGECGNQDRAGKRAALQPGPLFFQAQIRTGQAGLFEDHILKQFTDEITLSSTRNRDQRLPPQTERRSQRTDYAIKRSAFLSATGEVHATQQATFVVTAWIKDFLKKTIQNVLHQTKLLRKSVDERSALGIPFPLQMVCEVGLQLLFKQRKLRVETSQCSDCAILIFQRKRHAPHLRPLLTTKVREKLLKARKQIAFRHHYVNRKANTQALVQLL